jgi:translation initiation factor IF-3
VPEVRCVSENGDQLGTMPTSKALTLAMSKGLDLVEIAPNANPPVCKIINFGKYKYELARKEKETRKHQTPAVVKEIKFHPNVEEHDYQTKLRHIKEFLSKGYRVKVSVMFRGRENEHRELGYHLIQRSMEELANESIVEAQPKMLGNMLVMVLRPAKGGTAPQNNSEQQPADNKTIFNSSSTTNLTSQ